MKDSMKEILLIGGTFHRRRYQVPRNNYSLRLIDDCREIMVVDPYDPINIPSQEIKILEYGVIASLYGIESIFPKNVFFLRDTEPAKFLKNLLLDYIRP